MTDSRDNKGYDIIQIGTQCWMKQNLNYGSYVAIHSGAQVAGTKYCRDHSGVNDASCPMGGLYQWDEMMRYDETALIQGICPPGWHIPDESEWGTLFSFYISNGFAGSPLKSTGYSGYNALLDVTAKLLV